MPATAPVPPPAVLTTSGTDGACAAAAVLLTDERAAVHVTSRNAVPWGLRQVAAATPRPARLHVTGVGVADNLAEILEALRTLADAGAAVTWYCGRGYLDRLEESLARYAETVFTEAETNTAAVLAALGVPEDDVPRRLARLARQFVGDDKPPPRDRFWHDLVEAACRRYFQFGDDAPFLRTVRKLAGLLPVTTADEEEVEAFRRGARHETPALGSSPPMKALRETLRRLAPIEEPVLILGPSGAGKELIARALHAGSPRRGEAFLPINCAVLSTSPDLAHDRLFGHVAGAYTGAGAAAPGAFEEASGGTLFLDEVAELPLPVQTQLLRVLEEGTVMPAGTVEARPVDVRVLAATNRDLPALVREGRFRLDLYHRLGVLTVEVPPLRERAGDLPAIAGTVAGELQAGGHRLDFRPEDRAAAEAYDWPGNVRQFVNVLKRAAYLGRPVAEMIEEERARGALDAAAGAEAEAWRRLFRPRHPDEVVPEAEVRRAYMGHVLELFEGNRARAAEALGVSKNTLRKWVL